MRGLWSCCDYHIGLKLGLPTLVFVRGWLPQFMWPRRDWTVVRPEEQPRRSARGEDNINPGSRGWSSLDKIMIALAAASLAVAIMSFVRDVLAG
ncbi:MAG: hypothetical protein M3Z25_10285 [Actinomycetota bacterium]|nr:hypothetical protein [Actinomycetota bacterium]